MPSGWQNQVYVQPAAAVAGDRASQNPIFNYDAGPGGLVAGPAGVTIGRFAWAVPPLDPNGGPTICNSFGVGPIAGFVGRQQQGSNATYLSDAGMSILQGYEMALYNGGDFWIKNEGATQALRGQKAYANFATGAATFAATGSPATGATATGSTVTAGTFSVTGSISNALLTVTAVTSGTIVAGATITGSGIAAGTQIVSQVSGTTGGVGVYIVSISEQTVASTAVSGTYGILTVGTMTVGTAFFVGGILSGGTVAAGTQVTQLLTGTGGNGSTFALNNNTTSTSATLSETSNVETPFFCLTQGLPGELVKISDHMSASLS